MAGNGKKLICRSHPPKCGPGSRSPQQDTHWLPDTIKRTAHFDKTAPGDTRLEDYEPFDGLVYAAHADEASRIVADEIISARLAKDSTVANVGLNLLQGTTISSKYDFVQGSKTCRLNPKCSLNPQSGPILFEFTNDTILGYRHHGDDGNSGYAYYFLEVIDFQSGQSASRIFVVPKRLTSALESMERLRFDPAVRGGPWYWDLKTNKHYALKKTTSFEGGNSRKHTLDFLSVGDQYSGVYSIESWSVQNHLSCQQFGSKCKELGMLKTDAFLCFWAIWNKCKPEEFKRLNYTKAAFRIRKEDDSDDSDDTDDEGDEEDHEDDKENDRKYDYHGAVLFRTLNAEPRIVERKPASQTLNWKVFLSCLRDRNFAGAYGVARKIPDETLNKGLPPQCRRRVNSSKDEQ
ncbi:hypothetical protein HDU88_008945 [Geranomyces variabilis]|nr:hypothetical protein HDU88_008945 [Geranomyces variabilis]